MRPQHSHLTQAKAPVDGCPACALIRPAAMVRTNFGMLRAGLLGPILQPQ
jgi:hypothetical protein